MTKYITDSQKRRLVIYAQNRQFKPKATNKEYRLQEKYGIVVSPDCPFCPGNEKITPKEIDRAASKNTKGYDWLVRVFPNKYAITDVHEVIVHSPNHVCDIIDMSESELLTLFTMYQKRLRQLSKIGLPILFRNKGKGAGTSIPHPHSQIIVIPRSTAIDEIRLEPIKNTIATKDGFSAYCPEFSQYPYEVWLSQTNEERAEQEKKSSKKLMFIKFEKDRLLNLALLLQKVIRSFINVLGPVPYNYYIHPHNPFYLRIIPRITIKGGFELGTGLSVNIVPPKTASEYLRAQM